MTREEAIKKVKLLRHCLEDYDDFPLYIHDDDLTALDMAISALSAEGEYIRKEELFNKTIKRNSIWNMITNAEGKGLEEIVNDLPTYSFPDSAESKGEWIKIQSGDDKFPESIVCSKCKNENSHLDFDEHREPIGKVFITSKFCPNCGADMREPEDIIHKAIDNTIFAEKAYPNIKEELHKAVDMAEPKGEKGTE